MASSIRTGTMPEAWRAAEAVRTSAGPAASGVIAGPGPAMGSTRLALAGVVPGSRPGTRPGPRRRWACTGELPSPNREGGRPARTRFDPTAQRLEERRRTHDRPGDAAGHQIVLEGAHGELERQARLLHQSAPRAARTARRRPPAPRPARMPVGQVVDGPGVARNASAQARHETTASKRSPRNPSFASEAGSVTSPMRRTTLAGAGNDEGPRAVERRPPPRARAARGFLPWRGRWCRWRPGPERARAWEQIRRGRSNGWPWAARKSGGGVIHGTSGFTDLDASTVPHCDALSRACPCPRRRFASGCRRRLVCDRLDLDAQVWMRQLVHGHGRACRSVEPEVLAVDHVVAAGSQPCRRKVVTSTTSSDPRRRSRGCRGGSRSRRASARGCPASSCPSCRRLHLRCCCRADASWFPIRRKSPARRTCGKRPRGVALPGTTWAPPLMRTASGASMRTHTLVSSE